MAPITFQLNLHIAGDVMTQGRAICMNSRKGTVDADDGIGTLGMNLAFGTNKAGPRHQFADGGKVSSVNQHGIPLDQVLYFTLG